MCLALALSASNAALARPYAGVTGLAAAADSAAAAGTNPAASMRFNDLSAKLELITVYSDSKWEGQLGEDGATVSSEDSTTILVPSGYLIKPINDDFAFSFTMLGFGYSDDFGDWPGRYFIESYDSLSVSAFPSLAYRINDNWSVAGSVALSYASFEQQRAVANVFDPGYDDGSTRLETDGFDVGFGLSALYELSERTRFGLVYQSEVDPTQDGKARFSGLGPNTEAALDKVGLLGADVEVKSRSPQGVLGGVYHEFENDHAFTIDLAWVDFSSFELSEYYFDGQALSLHEATWQDAWAFAGSYSWPVSERWMLSAGAMYVSDLVEDEDRIFLLRLDDIWGLGFAAEWDWSKGRKIDINFSYLDLGEAPIESPPLPFIGSVTGAYSQHDLFLLRVGLSWGSL